ncbi:MAG: antA/AntB antirepressor family protein [Planctomycetaceae bacterium]|jgi:anti-repressor protein|nr:antA/AntB antirepressor family protein [Planctomycetaceae bacterium]
MNDLVTITKNNGQTVVSGRELHAALEVETPYHKWFPRMTEYGFEEGKDHWTILSDGEGFGKAATKTDHLLTLDMAKEISMLQRTDKGKLIRRYFIEAEKELHIHEAGLPQVVDRLRLQWQLFIRDKETEILEECHDMIYSFEYVSKCIGHFARKKFTVKDFKKWLNERGIGFFPDKSFKPYNEYIDKGWFRMVTHEGNDFYKSHYEITLKGFRKIIGLAIEWSRIELSSEESVIRKELNRAETLLWCQEHDNTN